MRKSLWLALLVVSVSCTANDTSTSPSPEYMRCTMADSNPAAPDNGAASSDNSLFGSFSKKNDYNCTNYPGICTSLGNNFFCNDAKGCCDEQVTDRCLSVANCKSNATPVCNTTDSSCVACNSAIQATGDQQCATWNTTQIDAQNRALCIGGKCLECRTNLDCKRTGKTFCDQTSNSCVGCTSNGQCPGSNICKLDESLLATGDTLANIGECVKTDDVAFVDSNTANCDTAGANSKPFCQISQAVTAGKSYINVKGYGSSKNNIASLYTQVTVSGVKQVVIIGPGRDADYATMQAVINGVTVTNGAHITLIGISVTNSAGQPAIQCNTSGTLYAQGVLITDKTVAPPGGIYAMGCTKVDVEKTKVSAANGYGLIINGGTGHRVVNNAFINSGSASETSGLRISGSATGLFAFNTIANNRQGVQCDTAATVTDSIVMDNAGGVPVSTGCQTSNIVSSGIILDSTYMTTGNDPKLITDSTNVCIDKGTANATIKDDYFSAARPAGQGYDIGFQEVR